MSATAQVTNTAHECKFVLLSEVPVTEAFELRSAARNTDRQPKDDQPYEEHGL